MPWGIGKVPAVVVEASNVEVTPPSIVVVVVVVVAETSVGYLDARA